MARQRIRVKSNHNFLLGLIVASVYGVIFWLLNRLSIRIGEDAIYYTLGKNIIFILICVIPIVLYFFKEFRKEPVIKHGKDYNPAAELEQLYEQNENLIKEEWERQLRTPRRRKSLPILPITLGHWAIIGSVFLIFAIGGLVSSIKDINGGTKTVILQETRVLYNFDTETTDYANVELQGVNNQMLYELRVKELKGTLIKVINTQHPYIVVTYYPNTETLVQLDIYTLDEVISIPYGSAPRDENLSANAIETLTSAQAKEPYEDVSLESLDLKRYETLANQSLEEVLNDVAPIYGLYGAGFATILPSDDNYETYALIMDELKANSDTNSSQECRIVFRDDVALVIVYNIRTNVVDDMYAVRCLYLK